MGYYTYYELTYEPLRLGEHQAIEEKLKKLNQGFWPFEEDTKWDTWEEDMKKLSLEFPDVTFHLWGEGEENIDSWYAHFKNGKVQICKAKITFDDFDERKLI